MRIGVGVMARAPSAPGKTRLAADLGQRRLGALREALLADTLETVCALPHVDVAVFVTPDGADAEVLALSPRPVPVIAQRGQDLGERMRDALIELIERRRYDAAILVGTDAPLLTAEHFDDAALLLRTRGGVVLGPADDGGYYLIGMTTVVAGLFDGIEWGSDEVLLETMRAAERLRIDACLNRGAYDIDTIADLHRLGRDLHLAAPDVAPNVRRYFRDVPNAR